MMNPVLRALRVPFLLAGLAGCSGAGTDNGGAPAAAAGSAAGGLSAGGAADIGGVGGGAGAQLGAGSGAAGASTTGGSLQSGGSSALGGSTAAGGSTGGGGSSPSAGGTSLGGGTGSGSGGSPATGTIPPGYPAPSADNVAKCKAVQPSDGFCPGGGVGPSCLECLFGGDAFNTGTTPTSQATMAAGNYLVTVQLSGAAASQTFISAESNRGLLAPSTTAAGQALTYAFVVNVRANEGQPLQTVPAGYPGLDLFFSGPSAPPVTAIGYSLVSAATKPTMVYLAGDSTVCDQDTTAFGGWGQMIPEFFMPPIGIANYADSGESSSSFYGSGKLWGAIKAHWVPGDWVMIQFGHNDKGVTDAAVQANLERYVTEALAANVSPIVVSPPARVQFTNGMEGDQSSLHAAAAKAAAAAKNVAYIDLTTLTIAWYNSLGSQAAGLKFHANGTDATHTNLAGATKIAELVAGEIKKQNLGLAKYLRP